MSKLAFVSGATGNLGTAVVESFVNAGYKVWGTTHSDSQNATTENCHIKSLNLLDQAATEEFINNILTFEKTIHTAVLTVGGYYPGSLKNTSIEDMHQQWRLNFETAFNAVKPILKAMRQQGKGRLFLIGSVAGKNVTHGTGAIAYALAKSLLFRLSEIINEESKEFNIACYVVVPNIIDTPQNRQQMPDADFSTWTKPQTIAQKILERAELDSKPTGEEYILMV